MKAEYVEINGQFVSKGYIKSHPELLRPDPPARIRAEESKPDGRGKGENRSVEQSEASFRYRVTILVLRPRLLDGHDNQRSAAKALVDAVTEWLGFRSDSDSALEWRYHQIKTSGIDDNPDRENL